MATGGAGRTVVAAGEGSQKRGLIKNWQQRYSKDSKYSSRGLGVYPAVTLQQARDLAFFYAHESKPSMVRAILGATEEQLAERMTPKRNEIR